MRNPPVITTTDITHHGYALGRLNGQPVFVSYALPDESVEVTLTDERRGYAIGVTELVLQPSADRVRPPCPYFRPDGCGGCQWQHADYSAQLRFKTRIVAEQLRRIGRIRDAAVRPAHPSPHPYGYRTHATFSVNAAGALSFVGSDGVSLQAIDQCLLLRPELQDLLERLRSVDFRGVSRVRLQVGSAPEDRAVVLTGQPTNMDAILAASDGASVVLQQDDQLHATRGQTWLTYSVADRSFRAGAGGFFQVNLAQAERLVRLVQQELEQPINRALDLYSGVGLFTAFLAERARHVISIEGYAPAVRDARHNLEEFPGTDLRVGSVEKELASVRGPFDVVVTDPPRAGMKRAVLERLLELRPKRILYVSCEPSTLARDTRLLVDGGFRLDYVQPVDMFPQTYHIESVAVFRRD